MRYLFFLLLLAGLSNCRPDSSGKNNAHRLIHNNDGTEILGNNWYGKRPLTLSDVHRYVDDIAASQVTTFMICSGSDFFYYRSKYGGLIGDPAFGGCPGNKDLGAALNRFYENALALEKEGTDIVEATLKRAHDKKMEAFISYRMNDLHFADTTTNCPQQYASFWRANPQLWTNDSTLNGWNARNALDFAHPEVREFKQNIIREQLLKYGSLIDGYELDFMRFIVYFRKAEAVQNAPLMTELVRSVRQMVDSVGKIHHKKILLTARVPATLKDCDAKGLDVREWAKLGLIDFVTLGVHWLGEPAMPVADFKKDFGADLPVYASIDDGGYKPRETYSHGMYRGMASHALAQGASGAYLFNYFLTAYNDAGQKSVQVPGTLVSRTISPLLLQEIGSLETLRKRNKVFCLSDGATSYDLTPNSPLPLHFTGSAEAGIFIGDNVAVDVPEEVILFVRTDAPGDLTTTINGHELKDVRPDYPGLFDKLLGLSDGQKVVAYLVPADKIRSGKNDLRFSSSEKTAVYRIELALKYGPVETHGFF